MVIVHMALEMCPSRASVGTPITRIGLIMIMNYSNVSVHMSSMSGDIFAEGTFVL